MQVYHTALLLLCLRETMNDITVKSTGFLIDELITAKFKMAVDPNPVNIDRVSALVASIAYRLEGTGNKILLYVIDLIYVSKLCWDAQQEIYELSADKEIYYIEIALAGIQAQKTNAQRNKLIRQIDEVLGEATVLGKTYE